ncbi:MAG: GAF domain-containing protein [Deltaproteobacteria bacterium]|nr:MAG: GAF domain-containing protein [Deltaproteobacteria bacterium]
MGDRRRDALLQIGLAIGSTVDIDALLNVVMGHVTALLSAERSTLYLVDRRRGEIWSKVLQGDGLREIRLPLGEGVAGDVVATGELANIPDAYLDRRFHPEFDKQSGFRTRSILCAPVTGKPGEVLGAVQVLNRSDGQPFDADDERAMMAVAAQIAVALENARLFSAERRKVKELDLLYSVERELAQAGDAGQLLDVTLSRATDLSNAEAGAALLLDEEKSELFFKNALGGAGAALLSARVPINAGIAGRVAVDGIPRIVHDAERESAVARELAQRFGYRSHSLCAAPIQSEGRILGVLELLNKRDGDFGDDDVKLLTMLGGQTGRALRLARDRAARERDERLRLLGQTIASVLHDLRSPLTVVQSYAELMADEPDKKQRLEYSEMVARQVLGINQMTREVLAYLRGESGFLPTQVHLDRFLGELREVLTRELTPKKIDLRIEQRTQCKIRIDEGKVKRAVINLARNAAEAMPDGGTFTISAWKDGERLVLSFADTGNGIPEAIRDKVFQPFVTEGKRDGTGLGLAIVKQVIEAHGGEIRFESTPGKGTTFTFSLPA